MIATSRSDNHQCESMNSTCESKPLQNLNDIRRKFLEQSDATLALKLQTEEFNEKKEWNKADRLTARQDAPLARLQQSEEEKRIELERLEKLEKLNKIIEKDREIARQLQEEEIKGIERDRRRRDREQNTDRQLQHVGQATRSASTNDSSPRTGHRSNHLLTKTGRSLDGGIHITKQRSPRTINETEKNQGDHTTEKEQPTKYHPTSSSRSNLEREIEKRNEEINRLLLEKEKLEEMMQNSRRDPGTYARAKEPQENRERKDGSTAHRGAETRTTESVGIRVDDSRGQPGRMKVVFEAKTRREKINPTNDESTNTQPISEKPPVYALPEGRIARGSNTTRHHSPLPSHSDTEDSVALGDEYGAHQNLTN